MDNKIPECQDSKLSQEAKLLQDHNKFIKLLRRNISQTEVENKKEDKMIFIKAVINGEVIAGKDIKRILRPTCESPAWQIILKDGSIIDATGNISVWTTSKEDRKTNYTEGWSTIDF
jgi:hypothetical protein